MGRWSGAFFVVWCISTCAVVFFSLRPKAELPIEFWNADKAYHCAAYAWLSALAMLSFPVRRLAVLFALGMIVLGILLEVGQHFVPGRSFSLLDLAANSLGVMLGILLARRVGRLPRK